MATRLSPDDGMSTAEYAVGTLGACTIALILHTLATDGSWFDWLTRLFNFLDGFPVPNLRLR
jgi:hypothetical protein